MRPVRAVRRSGALAVLLALLAAWGVGRLGAARPESVPETRSFVVTIVPLVVHEMQATLPFLTRAFSPGGVLGPKKEVYGFYPSTLVAYRGDTIRLRIINPTEDEHALTLGGLRASVLVKGLSSAATSFVASRTGIYPYTCTLEEHYPYMWGELVVLSPTAAGKGR